MKLTKETMSDALKETSIELLAILAKAQEDVSCERTAPLKETMDNIRKDRSISMASHLTKKRSFVKIAKDKEER